VYALPPMSIGWEAMRMLGTVVTSVSFGYGPKSSVRRYHDASSENVKHFIKTEGNIFHKQG
jgi:hypothetical protein